MTWIKHLKGKIIKNSLHELLPAKLILIVLDRAFIEENKHVDEITQAERRRLVENLRGTFVAKVHMGKFNFRSRFKFRDTFGGKFA